VCCLAPTSRVVQRLFAAAAGDVRLIPGRKSSCLGPRVGPNLAPAPAVRAEHAVKIWVGLSRAAKALAHSLLHKRHDAARVFLPVDFVQMSLITHHLRVFVNDFLVD